MAKLGEPSGGVYPRNFTDGGETPGSPYNGEDPISLTDLVPEAIIPMPTPRSGELFSNADGTLYGANKLGLIASTKCMADIDVATYAGQIDHGTLKMLTEGAREARMVNAGRGILDACQKVCPIMQNLGYCPLEIGRVLPINSKQRELSTVSKPLTPEATTAMLALEDVGDTPQVAKLKRRTYKALKYFFTGILQPNWTTRSITQEERMYVLDIEDHLVVWSREFGPEIKTTATRTSRQPSLF